MLVQSWQVVAIFVISFVFDLGLGRTFGEGRAWAKMDKLEQVWDAFQAVPSYCERFAREPIGFTADEQDAIAGIRYEEDDEPVHTYESPFCDDPACPCHCGHVLDGRIIVEQEILG